MDFELVHGLALKKIKNFKEKPLNYFMKAIMGGIYLSVAMILSVSLGATLLPLNAQAASIGFSMLFGIAFIMIVFLNGELFTGNVFVTSFALFNKTAKAKDVTLLLALNYLGNFVGTLFIGYIYIKSGSQHELVHAFLTKVSTAKLAYGMDQVFIKSILCNLIVCIAAYVSIKAKDEVAKIILMLIIVMAFVLPGFDHSIANMGFFAMDIFSSQTLSNLPAIMANIGVATVGNIIGGLVVYGLPMFYILKEN